MRWPGIHRRRLLAGLLAAGAAQVLLPASRAEEPRWLKLSIPETSLEMDVEDTTENYRVGGVNSSYEQLTLTPLIGLRTQGSIYHPNLLSFNLDGAAGWSWDNVTSKSSGSNVTRRESQDLQRYLAQVFLLSGKPYNASFYAAQDHTYRDYGAFSTFTVDSTRYGGRVSWVTESLNLNADVGYRNEQDSGLTQFSEVTETFLNFTGLHKRQWGQTSLTYRFDEFDNTYGSGDSQTSVNHSVGISDSETFGSRKQIIAATGAGYSLSEYGGQRTETVTANEHVTVNHRPDLSSLFSLDYSHSAMTSVSDSRLQGDYAVRHQLYESLTSRLDAHGNYEDSSSFSSTSSNDRYGLGWNENYSKRLSRWGRLSIGTGLVADHVDYNSSGGIVPVIGEAHTLYLQSSSEYRPEYLSHPAVITVMDVYAGTQKLTQDTDYKIVQSGELTEVQLIFPASFVVGPLLQGANHDSLNVTVTYQYNSPNNAAFESLNANFQIRLDLFGHLGIYGRLNWLDNNAPVAVLTETLTDTVGGADYTWRWLRTGAEYEDYDSNFSQYQAWRFFQDFSFHPDDASTLSVDFLQTFYRYPNNGEQTQYQFLTRYNIQLLYSLAWYVEGGYSLQNVMGTDESLASAKTGLNWSRGKMSLRTGYEFNGQTTSAGSWTEDRVRNRFYAYLKRTF